MSRPSQVSPAPAETPRSVPALVPLGYIRVNGQLQLDLQMVQVIRRLFGQYANGR